MVLIQNQRRLSSGFSAFWIRLTALAQQHLAHWWLLWASCYPKRVQKKMANNIWRQGQSVMEEISSGHLKSTMRWKATAPWSGSEIPCKKMHGWKYAQLGWISTQATDQVRTEGETQWNFRPSTTKKSPDFLGPQTSALLLEYSPTENKAKLSIGIFKCRFDKAPINTLLRTILRWQSHGCFYKGFFQH